MYRLRRLADRYNRVVVRCLWLCFAMGCAFEHGLPTGGGNSTTDGGTTNGDSSMTTDDSMPAMDASLCWSVAGVGVNVCLTAPLSGNLTFGSNTSIDTDSTGTGSAQCKMLEPGSSDVCVIAASQIAINGMRTVTASGDRPLVLLATSIKIDGTLDVASHVNGSSGPGANMSGCASGNDPTDDKGGGGQGGSFGTKGGDGGNEDGENSSRGTSGSTIASGTLRGGCPGADGGDGGGAAGDGGGAVLLLADSITFGPEGRINASGASGRGAPTGRKGGGGAGSGGMIVFSASTITVSPNTQIFANGGHGGGGSNNTMPGASGTDSISATSVGGGGNGAGMAGDGGNAYPAADPDARSATGGGDGGGGGGGGGGVILNYSTSSLGANVSPPAS